jgi:hypothetical protein
MSQELHYTSVPRGLKPGSRGFCTVGMTPHMPGPLVDRLEALSGYQRVFPPHDPSAALNPIVFSHLHLTIGGKVVSVLSRIGPAALDYSGRPNKYAHHMVLEPPERPEGGPAWLLSQPGFMLGAWEGEPGEVAAGRTVPQGDRRPGVATAWQALSGDGGWAGVLAETFLADPRRTVFLVFRPGMEILSLFGEALALLPASRRWDVDFSSYLSQLPQGVTCAWRGVLEGSDDAKNALRLPNAVVIDLCQAMGQAEGGALVHMARTGERMAHGIATPPGPPASGRHIPRMPQEPAAPHVKPLGRTGAARPRGEGGSYELLPELARLVPGAASPEAFGEIHASRRRWGRYGVGAALLVACIVPLVGAAFLLDLGKFLRIIGLKSDVVADVVKPSEDNRKKNESPEASKLTSDDQLKIVRDPASNAMSPKEPGPQASKPAIEPPKQGVEPPPPSRPVNQTSVAEKNKPIKPVVTFFSLPRLREGSSSVLGREISRSCDQEISGVAKEICGIKLLAMSDRKLHAVNRADGMNVETEATGGRVPIAQFKAESNQLRFTWLDEAKGENQATAALRDAVLEFARDGKQHYILLRDPHVKDSNAFDLTNRRGNPDFRPLIRDDYKPRDILIPWADKDALARSSWKLVFRGWKIVSRFSGAGELVIAEAKNKGSWTEKVDEPIASSGGVTLMIMIDSPANPQLVKVRFEFRREEIKIAKKQRDEERNKNQQVRDRLDQ